MRYNKTWFVLLFFSSIMTFGQVYTDKIVGKK